MRVQVMNLYTKVLLLLSVLNCKPIYKVCMQGSGTWLTSLCSVCKFVLIYCSWGAGSEPWGTCVDGVSCLSGGCHSIICLFAHVFFYLLCLGGRSPEAYGGHHVCVCVCVCLCVCVSAESFPELILCIRWKLSTETCNASLTQYCLEMKLVDFRLVAL